MEAEGNQEDHTAARHHSSVNSFKQILDAENKIQNAKKKVSEDLGDHNAGANFFEENQRQTMSVHDCNPGQNESDDKSEYTYVSVSNMSNNQGNGLSAGNSMGMMSPNERLPI